MFDLSKDIDSLTNFKRNSANLVKRMKKSGQPVVLTVNGRPELVVQDAAAYQRWLELIDRAETIVAVRGSLASLERGEGRPAKEVFEELRRKYEVPDSAPAAGGKRHRKRLPLDS